jgi:HSF-type DNA-binding
LHHPHNTHPANAAADVLNDTLVRMKGKVMMGRLIVHDRIKVEKDILPRYFNHSSFASLRRQLNYFSFVRVGKGRQRESTYINEQVVDIDDILHLKRRPAGTAAPDPEEVLARVGSFFTMANTINGSSNTSSNSNSNTMVVPDKKAKRDSRVYMKRRLLLHKSDACVKDPSSMKSSYPHLVSDEDDSSDTKSHGSSSASASAAFAGNSTATSLFAVTATQRLADEDILAGCSALLGLSSVNWD